MNEATNTTYTLDDWEEDGFDEKNKELRNQNSEVLLKSLQEYLDTIFTPS